MAQINVCENSASTLIREQELSRALATMMYKAAAAQDSDAAAGLVLAEACRVLHSKGAGVVLREAGLWAIRYGYDLPDELKGAVLANEVFPEAARCLDTGKPVIVQAAGEEQGRPAMLRQLHAETLLLLPLPAQVTPIGCVFFRYSFSLEGCGPFELSFAERTAAVLSLAVGKAELERENQALLGQREEDRARFDALLEEMPAGVLVVNTSGRLIRGNEQVERIWRRPLLRDMERGAFEFHGERPDGSPYLSPEWPLARTLAKGELVIAEEIKVARGDGSQGVISVSSGPVRDVRGRIIAAIMVVQDMTDRKEMERARSRLAAIVESSGHAVISLSEDEHGVITSWSRGAEKLYGYRAEEVIGRHMSLLAAPGFPEDIPDILKAISQGRAVDRHETMRMRKDGSLVPVSLSVSPVRNDQGRIIGASTIIADISDRRQVEEALRESESKFRKIASAAQDAVILIDSEGMVQFWNDAATKIFGYESGELMGKFLHSYIMPDRYQQDFKKGFSGFTSTGEGRFIGKTYEIMARKKDGTEFPVELSLASLRLKGRWNAIGIVRDITERKRVEQDLKRTVQELERSNTELQQFAYVASHDLQEPLRTVSSFVELLGRKYKGRLDEKADRYISFAVDGTHRMATLINDLLAYSRVGTQGGKFGAVDLQEVLGQVLGNLRTAMQESRTELTNDPLPTVTGDRTQLAQLLQNLLTNSMKFMRQGVQPRIRISTERREDAWVIGVHDNGIGIEPAYQERIFAIFQRLHTREEYPGTGVGLAICRRIVERHGGRLWVESKPGEGSTFYVTLPVRSEM